MTTITAHKKFASKNGKTRLGLMTTIVAHKKNHVTCLTSSDYYANNPTAGKPVWRPLTLAAWIIRLGACLVDNAATTRIKKTREILDGSTGLKFHICFVLRGSDSSEEHAFVFISSQGRVMCILTYCRQVT